MNTKYKHSLQFLEQQKDIAYSRGIAQGRRARARKSFAKGFSIGLVIAGLLHFIGDYSKIMSLWN
jgi:hypothetical protein